MAVCKKGLHVSKRQHNVVRLKLESIAEFVNRGGVIPGLKCFDRLLEISVGSGLSGGLGSFLLFKLLTNGAQGVIVRHLDAIYHLASP